MNEAYRIKPADVAKHYIALKDNRFILLQTYMIIFYSQRERLAHPCLCASKEVHRCIADDDTQPIKIGQYCRPTKIARCNGRSRSDFLSSVSCAEIDLRSVVFWDVDRRLTVCFFVFALSCYGL